MNREMVGRPAEILLVEDNLGDARLFEEALREGRINHRLTLVCDGFEAMEFLRRQGVFGRAPRPDLILLDLGLPKMDGRQLLENIKSDDDLEQIPVVILTASQAHEDYLRGELLHVDCYLTKPVDLEKFVSVVRQLKRNWLLKMLLPAPC
jgi:chemotaxis family two-component system response regulator Rcp1